MKICIITASLNHGGASAVAQDVAKGMAQKGHDVLFVCSGEKSKSYFQNGYSIRILSNILKNPAYHYANPLLMIKLYYLLQRFKPDVLNIHNINLQTFSLCTLLFSLKYPTVWTLHDLWSICMTGWPSPPDCNQILQRCSTCPTWSTPVTWFSRLIKETVFFLSKISIVCPSKWMKAMIRNSRLTNKTACIVHNGIEKIFYSSKIEENQNLKIELSSQKKVLLFSGGKKLAGQLPAERKGLEYLFSALSLLGKNRTDVELLYIGDPIDLPHDFKIPIQFKTGISRMEMKKYYEIADLFVLPTLADNFPLTILEAMACKTPIISTNVGGIPEIITSDETGILCQPKDYKTLAKKIDYALSNPDRCSEMAENAYQRLKKTFTFERMIDKYEEVYIKTIADRRK